MLWRFYFRLMAVVFVIGIVADLAGARSIPLRGPLDVMGVALDGVMLIGLFGYAWKRQLFTRGFWKVFVPLALLWDIGRLVLDPSRTTVRFLPETIIAAGLVLPMYIALFHYAFGRAMQLPQPPMAAERAF
jgi:hypothetical protein